MQGKAVLFLLLGMLAISINDAIFKLLSGAYALHQLVFIRALIGLCIIFPLIIVQSGIKTLKISKPGLHILRGLLIVMANLTFFAGLASLPLAEASAIIFVAPVLITVFSYYFLDESMDIWRAIAVLVGLAGMVFVVQPFGTSLQLAFLWPLAGAVCYAGFNVSTRYLGRTESISSLAVSSTVAFLIASLLMGLILGDGKLANSGNVNLDFVLRAWRWPDSSDLWLIATIGGLSSIIAFAMAAAYRVGEASFLAPFEYVNLPFVVLWGFLIFNDLPNVLAVLGMILIMVGGFITAFRERSKDHHREIFDR